MTTTLSNTEMINNTIAILEHIKLNDELDNYDNFKGLMAKVTTAAIKDKKVIVIKQKKDKSTPYTDFVKAKMPEVKDLPKGEKFKRIAELWKAYKAANWNVPNAIKKQIQPKESKQPNQPNQPKESKESKESKQRLAKPIQPKKPKEKPV